MITFGQVYIEVLNKVMEDTQRKTNSWVWLIRHTVLNPGDN